MQCFVLPYLAIMSLNLSLRLTSTEFTTLLRNLEKVVSVHEDFLSQLEFEGEKSSADQRVGGVFLQCVGELFTGPHHQYCSHHPRAVAHMQEHKLV